MKLHTFPMSPNSIKVMAVIHQLGLDVEVNVVDLTKGETMTEEFRALNPNQKIPVLEDEDFIVWESQTIMKYLAEKHMSSLIPKLFTERITMDMWLNWNLAHFSPAVGGVVWERVAPSFVEGYKTDEAALAKSMADLQRYAPILDAHLSGKEFVVGSAPTLADVALASSLVHMEMAQLPMEPYTNLMAWYQRVAALDYFKKAVPAAPSRA